MAFLDKLSNVAKSAADKTGDMMEVTKLNTKINGSKSKIAAVKTQLGEYYWSKYVVGETLDAEAMELCAQIKAENDTIEELNRQIQNIKATPPPAQAQVNAASGAPAFAAPQPEAASCPSCGQPVSAGKKFCPECGAAVQ